MSLTATEQRDVEREKRIRKRLREDLTHYAKKCLKIRTKNESIQPLVMNEAQLHIHRLLEQQLADTGWVRALILKGRQQGCSTYVEARFYHRLTHSRGKRAFILTHKDDATKNLFDMADRYHDRCPDLVKPSTGASNAKELYFDKLDSGFQVSTAGSKETGRSATIQMFHGSEVAYWPNDTEHMAGVMQAVPDGPGTEVVLESTSAGAKGEFHRLCMDAHEGKGDYILIFVPWFWQKEYTRKPPPDFERDNDERALAERYNLDDSQLAWRREKIRQLKGVHAFRREYPCSVEEAFAVEKAGALWTRGGLDKTRVMHRPELVRTVVGVDPPSGLYTDCGIVTCGMSKSKEIYTLDDRSHPGKPEEWGMTAVRAFIDNDADAIVYEKNQGGEMVASVIRTAWEEVFDNPNAPLIAVWAAKSKQARAEPISILWTATGGWAGHIVGHLVLLEDELCTWEPNSGMESPNRLDAKVWAATELLGGQMTGTPTIVNTPGGWGGERES